MIFRGVRDGFCSFAKSDQSMTVLYQFSKISSRRGSRICKEAFRVAGAEQETSASEKLGSQGADFLRGGCILEHQMFTDDFA